MANHDDGQLRDGRVERTSSNDDRRICPTRIDRAPVLFAHRVIGGQCQDRQRGHYHKCFTCAWNNAWVKAHGVPATSSGVERRAFIRAS